MSDVDRLERSYRRWMHCYPVAWQQRHGEEMLSILLQQAEHDHRRHSPDLPSIIDIVGHGLGERVESILRWIPCRQQLATVASMLGGVLAATFLVMIEIDGALHREATGFEADYFVAGPFLSIGAIVYLTWIASFVCIILRRSGPARLLVGASVVLSILMMTVPPSLAGPRLLILVLLISVGMLALVDRVRTVAVERKILVAFGLAVVTVQAVVVAVLPGGDQLPNGYGNVALRQISAWLAAVGSLGVIAAAFAARIRPGWLSAAAICLTPLLVFWVLATQISSGRHSGLLGFPLLYVALVALVVAAHRRGERRSVVRQ